MVYYGFPVRNDSTFCINNFTSQVGPGPSPGLFEVLAWASLMFSKCWCFIFGTVPVRGSSIYATIIFMVPHVAMVLFVMRVSECAQGCPTPQVSNCLHVPADQTVVVHTQDQISSGFSSSDTLLNSELDYHDQM